jgi:hypothetical protein
MVNASTVAKSCQATRTGMSCTVETLPETKQTQENIIYADQIRGSPAAICHNLIRFFSVQLNL